MRRMCGPRSKLSRTFWPMIAGTLGIAGIPGSAGLFSKVAMLWRAYQASWAYWLVGVVTAFLTSFYMFRLMYMTFAGEYRGVTSDHSIVQEQAPARSRPSAAQAHHGIHESPRVMLIPLAILAF